MRRIHVIGGANVDILARSYGNIIMYDSNPGEVEYSFGGVGHNIVLNLAQMGCDTGFVTAFSTDRFGQEIREQCRQNAISLQHSQIIDGHNSSMYLAVVTPEGDMNVAIADMEILDHLDIDKIKGFLSELEEDDILVIDTNLTERQIAEITGSTAARIYADPISTAKAVKIRPFLGRLEFLKPNALEAECLSEMSCTPEGYRQILDWFLVKGVRNIAISLGRDGIIASDGQDYCHMVCEDVTVVNTTGAGDSFMAGYIYGTVQNLDFRDKLCFAMATSHITIASEKTVSEEMSRELLDEYYEKVRKTVRIEELR